jgi:hypothetical protein
MVVWFKSSEFPKPRMCLLRVRIIVGVRRFSWHLPGPRQTAASTSLHPCRTRLLTYPCTDAGVGTGCRQSSEPGEHCNNSSLLICSRPAQQAVPTPCEPHPVKHVGPEQHERVIYVALRKTSVTKRRRVPIAAVSHHHSPLSL